MKRILLVIFVLGLFASELKAQMQKGTWMLEGNVGLSRIRTILPGINENLNPQSSYTLHPKAGIFIKDRLAVGLSGLFGNSWTKNKNANRDSPFDILKTNYFRYGGGMFLRKYVEFNEHLSFFGEVGADNSWEKYHVKYTDSNQNSKSDDGRTFQAQGILGLQYLISPKVGVHMQTNLFQYRNTQILPGFGTEISEFRAGFLIDPRFGLTIFL